MDDLAVVIPQGLSPKGLPLALLKVKRVHADVPRRLAAARTRHKEGREEWAKARRTYRGRDCAGYHLASARIASSTRMASRLSPKSLLAVPLGTRTWDAEVSQIPQATCLVEVLEEGKSAVALEEVHVCAFITAVPITKLFAWGEGDSGGHVLRETTSRCLCGLVCPSRTSGRGGEGHCVKEGGGEEGIARDAVQTIEDACAPSRSCRSSCRGRCLRCVSLWGRESGGGRGGCSSVGYHRARGAGSVGRQGGDRSGSLVKALLKVPRILHQPTQIDQATTHTLRMQI
jgi:hypothetical protein